MGGEELQTASVVVPRFASLCAAPTQQTISVEIHRFSLVFICSAVQEKSQRVNS